MPQIKSSYYNNCIKYVLSNIFVLSDSKRVGQDNYFDKLYLNNCSPFIQTFSLYEEAISGVYAPEGYMLIIMLFFVSQ